MNIKNIEKSNKNDEYENDDLKLYHKTNDYKDMNQFSSNKSRDSSLKKSKISSYIKSGQFNTFDNNNKIHLKFNEKGIIDRIQTITNNGFVNSRARNVFYTSSFNSRLRRPWLGWIWS